MKYYPLFVRILLVLAVQQTVIKGDNCCGKSDCTASCPWAGTCADGRNNQCMRQIAGGFTCRDNTACLDYDTCDEEQAAYRTGQLCRGFPWYNGGYPLDNIQFDNDYKTFNCTQPSANSHFCSKYDSMDDSLDDLEFGRSSCVEVSSNGEYCQRWEHVQSEYKKCWTIWVVSDDSGAIVQQNVCCSKENRLIQACCNMACDKSFYNAYPPEIEYLSCVCQEESVSGKYCQLWTCEQFSWPSQSYAEGREYETYTCLEADPLENYCSRWKGNVESIEEFEVDKCYCNTEAQSGQYCQDWVCEEIGADMWYPNLYWNFLSVLLGGIGHGAILFSLFVSDGWKDIKRDIVAWRFHFILYLISFLLWSGGFIIIGVWKAGIAVLLISGSILLFPMLAMFMYALWHVYQLERQLNPRSVHTAGKCSFGLGCGLCSSCSTNAPVVIVNDDFSPRSRSTPYSINNYRNVAEEERSSGMKEVELEQVVVQDELEFSG